MPIEQAITFTSSNVAQALGLADMVAAITIKERGRSSLACGESEKNAQAQVNSGRSEKPTPNQQQESTEVISSASY